MILAPKRHPRSHARVRFNTTLRYRKDSSLDPALKNSALFPIGRTLSSGGSQRLSFSAGVREQGVQSGEIERDPDHDSRIAH